MRIYTLQSYSAKIDIKKELDDNETNLIFHLSKEDYEFIKKLSDIQVSIKIFGNFDLEPNNESIILPEKVLISYHDRKSGEMEKSEENKK